jgi:hypothetical protein
MHRPLSSLFNRSSSALTILFTAITFFPQSASQLILVTYSHPNLDQATMTTAQDIQPMELLRKVGRG